MANLSISNKLTPALARIGAGVKNKKPILEAIGLQLVSITKRAFTDSSLRPTPWAPKVDGTPATLRRSGALWHSVRVSEVTNALVKIASDRIYSAIHQLGGKAGRGHKVTIPPRPYMPILDKKLTPLAKAKVMAIVKDKVKALKP